MNTTTASGAASTRSGLAVNPWLIAMVVTLGAFMEVLDTTIVNVALPHIAGTMSASNDESTWVLTSYLVANGIVLIISGFFTRLFGRKRYFLICIAMFTLCSFLCGVSTSLPQIIIFRLLQGFFGGGLQPCQQSIILDTFPPAKRAQAFGITAMATVVAPVLGPFIGGWITDSYSWRWIFLINIPIGLFTFFAVMAVVHDSPVARAVKKLKTSVDYVGLGLITLGLGALQVVLDRGEDADWLQSDFIKLLTLCAVVGIVGAICWLLYTKKPIVNLRVMGDRNFAVGCCTMAAMAFVLYASAVLLPQLSEQQLGYTATLAGLILMPGAVALIMLIIIVSKIMPFVQTRFLVVLGFLVLSSAFLYSSGINPQIDFRTLMEMRIFQTLGLGFLFVPISSIAYLTVPAALNEDAAALFTMFRNVAGSIGISVSTALITTRSQVRTSLLGEHLTPFSPSYTETLSRVSRSIAATGQTMAAAQQSAVGWVYRELQSQAQLLAYVDVFRLCAVLAIVVAPIALLFSPVKAGKSMGGH